MKSRSGVAAKYMEVVQNINGQWFHGIVEVSTGIISKLHFVYAGCGQAEGFLEQHNPDETLICNEREQHVVTSLKRLKR